MEEIKLVRRCYPKRQIRELFGVDRYQLCRAMNWNGNDDDKSLVETVHGKLQLISGRSVRFPTPEVV